tara:strand:- start:980 stop:1135 length:156 start_codon:yes stop_codon:yes gene_type:complete
MSRFGDLISGKAAEAPAPAPKPVVKPAPEPVKLAAPAPLEEPGKRSLRKSK